MNKTITRRKFVGLSVATGATILAGGKLLGSTVRAGLALIAPGTATNPVFKIGGDLEVNRLGFGAMPTGRKRTSYSLPKRSILIRRGSSSRPKAVTPGQDPVSGCRTVTLIISNKPSRRV